MQGRPGRPSSGQPPLAVLCCPGAATPVCKATCPFTLMARAVRLMMRLCLPPVPAAAPGFVLRARSLIAHLQEETDEERGRRIASQWTHDPEAATAPVTVRQLPHVRLPGATTRHAPGRCGGSSVAVFLLLIVKHASASGAEVHGFCVLGRLASSGRCAAQACPICMHDGNAHHCRLLLSNCCRPTAPRVRWRPQPARRAARSTTTATPASMTQSLTRASTRRRRRPGQVTDVVACLRPRLHVSTTLARQPRVCLCV